MTSYIYPKGSVSTGGGLTPEQQDQLANLTLLLSTKADQQYVLDQLAALVGTAPETLNTIHEIAAAIASETSALDALNEMVAYRVRFDIANQVLTELQKSNARGNIGAEAVGVAAGLVAAITPASINAATAEQGAKADTALQSGDLAPVAFSGLFSALASIPAALLQIAGVSADDNDILQRKSGEWVSRTIAQLLDDIDLPAGNAGQVQYNNGGVLAGAEYVLIENGAFVLKTQTSTPVTPTDGVAIYVQKVAGRSHVLLRDDGGLLQTMQSNLIRNKPSIIQVVGDGSGTLTTLGSTALTLVGSGSGVSLSASKLGQMRRSRATSNAVVQGQAAGWYDAQRKCWIGNATGLGGFWHVTRFGVSDTTLITAARTFIGLTTSIAAPTNVNPFAMTNVIGVGQDPSAPNPQNLYFYIAGTSASINRIDTGFLINNTDFYELHIFCKPNGTQIHFAMENLITGGFAAGYFDLSLLPATQQPANNVFFAPRLWRNNNLTLAGVSMDLSGMLLETDN